MVVLQVNLSDADYEILEEAAEDTGQEVNELVETLISVNLGDFHTILD